MRIVGALAALAALVPSSPATTPNLLGAGRHGAEAQKAWRGNVDALSLDVI